ncbi:putative Thd1, partial [Operophtera brumata]
MSVISKRTPTCSVLTFSRDKISSCAPIGLPITNETSHSTLNDVGAAEPWYLARLGPRYAITIVKLEEVEEKPKPTENQDDGYETSNSGEAARRKPSSAEGSPAPPRTPPPPAPPYDPTPLMRYTEPEPEYRAFEPPPDYQHFPFPKYNEPYAFKRENMNDMPFDMSQHGPQHPAHHQQHMHQQPHHGYKREDEYSAIKRECDDPYSFVEEDPMCGLMQPQPPLHMQHMHPHHHPHMMHQQMIMNQPKKRGRKKKIKDEN